MSALLEIEGVSVRFGGVDALTDVSFSVETGEFLSLIGPNGAGKTTLLRTVIGVVAPQHAVIRLAGQDISRLPTHKRARLGLAMTHQIVRPFASMTVLENVTLAAGHKRLRHIALAMGARNRDTERQKAQSLLDALEIGDQANQPVHGQPLGVLKRVEVARALALDPKLLLLDEPLAGLNSLEAHRLADTLVGLNQDGTTIVMIEHNLGEVLRISGRLVVLDNGRKIAAGKPGEVMRNPVVRAAYLGKDEANAAA